MLSKLSPQLSFLQQFPGTVLQIEKVLGLKESTFTRYVVCSKCYSVYKYEDCFNEGTGDVAVSKHQTSRYSRQCTSALLKRVELLNKHRPIKVYCYMPLYYYLHSLLNRSGLLERCEHWKSVSHGSAGVYSDIYDGKLSLAGFSLL